MKSELVAEQTVNSAGGRVRLTLARHDDGHYSGIASLVRTGQRVGMVESHTVDGVETSEGARVDQAVVGAEVAAELERMVARTAQTEHHVATELLAVEADGLGLTEL